MDCRWSNSTQSGTLANVLGSTMRARRQVVHMRCTSLTVVTVVMVNERSGGDGGCCVCGGRQGGRCGGTSLPLSVQWHRLAELQPMESEALDYDIVVYINVNHVQSMKCVADN